MTARWICRLLPTIVLLIVVAFPAAGVEAPIALSDPDGQELLLEELTVQTAVHGMLSLTELEMRFRNPRAEIAEGRFTCVLPAGATISRFAKEVGGVLMEGEVVERMRANRIYDEILHEMRDPALLEQDQGNRFSARIFPIEPHGAVRLVLSYTELVPAIDGVRVHHIPLRGLPRVARFRVHGILVPLPGEGELEVTGLRSPARSQLSSSEIVSFTETDWVPEDIELRRAAGPPALRVLRAGEFYLASYIGAAAPEPPRGIASWLVYLDTSASAALAASHRIRALEEIFASLPPGDSVEIVAFDQDRAPLFEGSAGEAARRIAQLVRDRRLLGGTDLAAAVADLRQRVEPGQRVVFVTDGVATQGETDLHDLRAAFEKIPAGVPLHALVLGSAQSAETLRALTRGRGRTVQVPFTASMPERAREAASLLQRPLGDTFSVRDEGAEWIHPALVDDVLPGREVLVVGRLAGAQRPAIHFTPVHGAAGAFAVGAGTLLPAEGFETLLEREAYRGYLQHLRERETAEQSVEARQALAREQVRVSIERRILIPRTTLLVLESEIDYQRFGLDRRALASILTIGLTGIAETGRAPIPKHRPMPLPKPSAVAEAITVTVPEPVTEIAIGEAPAESDSAPVQILGGVVGGVAGGVSGGVAEAPPPPVEVEAPEMTETITVAAHSTQPGEPAQTSIAQETQAAGTRTVRSKWAQPWTPADAEIADLMAELEESPLDRALHNRIGDALLGRRDWQRLAGHALQWQPYDPENPQVYELLSEAALGLGRIEDAVRAAGSLVELAPARPELLQRAGLLLLRIAEAVPPEDVRRAALFDLALTPLRRAVEQRPDRVNAHRHLALALWRAGKIEDAARVLEDAAGLEFEQWYGDAARVVREELGWVYRAWKSADPARAAEIEDRASRFGVDLERSDDLRITLAWETDANDVDLHVVEPGGGECFYANPQTKTLELYGDVTQGLGPEVIRSARRARGTYRVGAHYYDAGPMGVSRGIVVILRAGPSAEPRIDIVPFRLVDDGQDADVYEIARVD